MRVQHYPNRKFHRIATVSLTSAGFGTVTSSRVLDGQIIITCHRKRYPEFEISLTPIRHSEFFGWGLQMGAEGTRWLFGNWRLFGRAGTSLLLGYSDTQLLETHPAGTVHADVTEDLVYVVPVIDLSLGLSWHCGRWQIRGGYEFTHWFNLFSERDFVDDVNEGKSVNVRSDLSLDGLFLQAGWVW